MDSQFPLLPKALVVITGKGADKKAFETEVEEREKSWERVRVRTAWLELEDYPRLLGEFWSFLRFCYREN